MRTSSSVKLPRVLTRYALLLCLCLIFSYLEVQFPIPLPLPGCKPGFANIVITFCALSFGLPEALLLSLLRVALSSLLFGGFSGFWFSFAGALAAFSVLAVLKSAYLHNRISMIGLCAACAAAHNIGQLLAAQIMLGSSAVFSYLPVLMIAACVTGCLSGVILYVLLPALARTGIIPDR